MRRLRILIGVGIWIVGIAALSRQIEQHLIAKDVDRGDVVNQLWTFATEPRAGVALRVEMPVEIRAGDPIFVSDPAGELKQIGEITSAAGAASERTTTTSAQALLYPDFDHAMSDIEFVYQTAPGSMEWVLRTMLPPDTRQQIADEIAVALEKHRDEVLGALKPVVRASVRDAIDVVQDDLGPVIENHREELSRLAGKYHDDMVDDELVPLVRDEIWPIVRKHAEPTVNEIGKGLWNRASVWRFAWRYLYDASPLPERNKLRAEWDRFVEREAVPELKEHTDIIVSTVERIVADASQNKKVRDSIRRNILRVIDDPEVQRIVWRILREAVVDNPRVRTAVENRLQSPEALHAFRLTGDRMEPVVRRIGELLFGTRESGITPEFAAVLRNQILQKDRRWFVVRPRRADDGAIIAGGANIIPVYVDQPATVSNRAAHPHIATSKGDHDGRH